MMTLSLIIAIRFRCLRCRSPRLLTRLEPDDVPGAGPPRSARPRPHPAKAGSERVRMPGRSGTGLDGHARAFDRIEERVDANDAGKPADPFAEGVAPARVICM